MRKSADQLKRASVSKTGELNLSKIYSHQFNEDIFKKITVTPGAKSHGLVIFVDWSGSMDTHLENTVKQLFNIVMFCKKVNIPYEVYTFTDVFECDRQNVQYKQNDLMLASFKLINILSSRMTAAEFTKAAEVLMKLSSMSVHRHGIFGMGGTPLNEVVISAFEIVPEFQKKYKLQIVNTIFLTDGDGSMSGRIYSGNNTTYMRDANYSDGEYIHNTHIIRDTVTKHEEIIKINSSKSQTSALLKLLKKRAKCNVIGFYILAPNEFKRYVDCYVKPDEMQATRSSFSKDHCAVIKNAGFDEYYLLRSAKGESSEETELEVNGDMTSKKMASEFKKFIKKKSHNRNVLNRFISLIA
jgi:hypothetical protein